tara:strand:- start:97 stop:294 length:198 start_codon:yes stop_codon:yes gene_type:complete
MEEIMTTISEDRLEEILSTNEQTAQAIRWHFMWAQELQQVQRTEDAQVHLDKVSQILNALEGKPN